MKGKATVRGLLDARGGADVGAGQSNLLNVLKVFGSGVVTNDWEVQGELIADIALPPDPTPAPGPVEIDANFILNLVRGSDIEFNQINARTIIATTEIMVQDQLVMTTDMMPGDGGDSTPIPGPPGPP